MKAIIKSVDWERLALLHPAAQVELMRRLFTTYDPIKVITCSEYHRWCCSLPIAVEVTKLPHRPYFTITE